MENRKSLIEKGIEVPPDHFSGSPGNLPVTGGKNTDDCLRLAKNLGIDAEGLDSPEWKLAQELHLTPDEVLGSEQDADDSGENEGYSEVRTEIEEPTAENKGSRPGLPELPIRIDEV